MYMDDIRIGPSKPDMPGSLWNQGFNPIPYEYQGWIFLIFLLVALIILLYGFYLIGTDKAFAMPSFSRRRTK